MSAVKNLRAMFEQKGGETSPPDRGRSPGAPYIVGADSPRPLSKVRTSFIAVEKDGRIGLQRGGSQDSIPPVRKLSGESNTSTPTAGTESSNPFDKASQSPAKTSLKAQPVVESPGTAAGSKDAPLPVQEAQGAKTEILPSTDTRPKGTGTDAPASKPSSPSGGEAPAPEAGTTNGTGSGKDEAKAAGKEAIKPTTHTTKRAPKPLAAASASRPAAKPEKSPAAGKAPQSPAGTSARIPATKKTPERKVQQTVTPRATPASKTAAPSSIKKPPPLQASPGAAFVKPKPKSPTRPIKLPPSLTTHTAASGSKVNTPRQSLSRASGNAHSTDSRGRAPSRASASTGGTASDKSTATKGSRRQSSTMGRPRPSLGPPPKQPAKDHPPTKREKEVDEGFLARMMRPTQSSASKTTEKVQTTPPRRAAATGTKKPAVGKPIKKVVAKSPGAASPSGQSQSSAAHRIATEAEHAATAAEIIETAKAAEGEATLPAEAGQKSAAREVAPVVEQSETAEEVIEATKRLEGEVAPPELAPSLMPKESAREPAVVSNGSDTDVQHDETTKAYTSESKEAVDSTKAADSADTPNAEEVAH
ncbi:hypothetical protein MFIFM68171_00784 [Madurella fahalii]|uniref:Uncharacterized protein n=1 Tax=Madurella fahalii TaxID=1157608 RepID=A0ABQ0FYT2_9PEZI